MKSDYQEGSLRWVCFSFQLVKSINGHKARHGSDGQGEMDGDLFSTASPCAVGTQLLQL